MHRRGLPISLVFCLFSSSRCLFIVLAHKQDRRPVAKIKSENVEGIRRSEEKSVQEKVRSTLELSCTRRVADKR